MNKNPLEDYEQLHRTAAHVGDIITTRYAQAKKRAQRRRRVMLVLRVILTFVAAYVLVALLKR